MFQAAKKFLIEDFERNKFTMLAGGILALTCHPLYYCIYKFWLIQPYESAFFRLTSAAISIPLLFIHRYPEKYKPLLSLYWYFWVIFVLPITFTYDALMNDFSKLWIFGETMMLFLVILFIPNLWLMLTILISGCILAYVFFRLNSDINLTFTTTNATECLVLLPCTMACGALGMLSGKRGELEKRKSIMKSIAASIVHEIRNPLNTINLIGIQIGRLLEKDSEAEKLSKSSISSLETKSELIDLTSDISKTVFDANNIINIILGDLSEKRISKDDFIVLEVDEVLPEIVSRYSFNSEEEKSRVRLDVSDNNSRNFVFKAVLERFQFIIFNLLKNALYYARQYPDLIITIGADPEKRKYKGKFYNVIYVKDINGPGIKSDLIPKLFDDFYTVGKKEGTGLGLSFCKRNMNLFGGDIICESGVATKFSLLFPVIEEEDREELKTETEREKERERETETETETNKTQKNHSTKHSKNSALRQQKEEEILIKSAIATKKEKEKLQKQKDDLRNISQNQSQNHSSILQDKNILIADDDHLTLKNLKEYLIDLGAKEVITANNGQEMLNKFIESNQNPTNLNYDIIITDISMPIMNGDEAAKLIREYEKQHNLKPIPIIAATGNEKNLLSFYKSGINDCFIKGEDYKKMVRVMGIWVG